METLENSSFGRRYHQRYFRSISHTYKKLGLIANKNKLTRVPLEPLINIKPNICYLKQVKGFLNKNRSHFHIKLSPIPVKKTQFIEKCDEEDLKGFL